MDIRCVDGKCSDTHKRNTIESICYVNFCHLIFTERSIDLRRYKTFIMLFAYYVVCIIWSTIKTLIMKKHRN